MKEKILDRLLILHSRIEEESILEDIYRETREFERLAGKKELIKLLYEECEFLKTLTDLS